jgi:tetratricopeptide (TPR) repeat protein
MTVAICLLTVVPASATTGETDVPGKPTTSSTRAPTIESQDKALAAALLQLAAWPSADSQMAVGSEYARLGLLDDAFSYFTAALKLNPREAAAYDWRARIWRDWGFPERGLADAARAAYYAPLTAPVHNTWGTLLAATGLLRQAREQFERARALAPQASYPLTNLCYTDFVLGDTDRAIAECRQALAVDERSAVAGNNLALSLAAAEQYAAAEEQFRTVGGAMIGHYNAGVVYLAARRFSEARAAFDAVVPNHPLAPGATARAQQARDLAGQSQAAPADHAGGDRRP